MCCISSKGCVRRVLEQAIRVVDVLVDEVVEPDAQEPDVVEELDVLHGRLNILRLELERVCTVENERDQETELLVEKEGEMLHLEHGIRRNKVVVVVRWSSCRSSVDRRASDRCP